MDIYEHTTEAITQCLGNAGYVQVGATTKPGDQTRAFVQNGETVWVSVRNRAPSVFSEFANDYSEIHAMAFGLIHSVTRFKPMQYTEIGGLSPELEEDIRSEYHYYLGAFWALRIVVALVVLVVTGSLPPGILW